VLDACSFVDPRRTRLRAQVIREYAMKLCDQHANDVLVHQGDEERCDPLANGDRIENFPPLG